MKGEGALIQDNPPGGPCHNVPLGTLVLRAGLMPEARIEDALQRAVTNGRKLGEELCDRGLEERDLVRLLAAQHAQPFVDLTRFPIDWDAARLLPPTVAQAHCALPIAQDLDEVIVAVPDPEDGRQHERLRKALQRHIRLVAAARGDIKEAIDTLAPRERPTVTVTRARYEVVVTLVNGRSVVVETPHTRQSAQAAAERVAALAQVGALIEANDTSLDGAEVVAVEILASGEQP
jgi:hypothetical protein